MVPAQRGTPEDGARIRSHSGGVEWLGRNWAEAGYVGIDRKAADQELLGGRGSGAATGWSPGVLNKVG